MKKIALLVLSVVCMSSFVVAGGDMKEVEPAVVPVSPIVEEEKSGLYAGLGIAALSTRDQSLNFFDAEDVRSLADAIVDLYERPEFRRSLAEQATERFGRDHCWSNHKKIYLELVSELIDSLPRSAAEDRPMPK